LEQNKIQNQKEKKEFKHPFKRQGWVMGWGMNDHYRQSENELEIDLVGGEGSESSGRGRR